MRTLDPNAADLFFVPTFTFLGQAGNTGCPKADVAAAAHHLQRTMPYFWQRHGGADHVFFATGDLGFCGMDSNSVGKQLAKNPIFVSHFGLLGGLGAMRPDMRPDKQVHTLEQQLENGEWVFAPHKDVVVPAYTTSTTTLTLTLTPTLTPTPTPTLRYVQAGTPRTAPPGCPILPRPEQLDKCTPSGINLSRGWRKLLVHAGGIWGWNNNGPKRVSSYSLGMRQRLFQEFGNTITSPEPRILISSSSIPDSMWEQFKYCLAPAGAGFGIRMAKSAAQP